MALGTGAYAVTFTEWGGRILWQSATATLSSVDWAREKNATTKATAAVILPPEITNLLEPWIHLMQVHRDDVLVWEGIVMRLEASWSQVTVEASDAGIMFERRRIPHGRNWRQHDATQVMVTMVEDALGYKDPTNLVEGIESKSSRIWVTGAWASAESMVVDAIDTLVEQGLDWCISSGRLLVGPVAAAYTTAQISDRDFDAGMTIVKDGNEVVTDALVTGDGVWGQWAVDTPIGLVQAMEDADGAVRAEEAQEQARRIVEDAAVTPRRMTVPSGSRLLPGAPVTLEELVPGVLVPVASRQTGVVMASIMQLTSVEVTADSSGETVSITLEEVDTSAEPNALPDPADLDWRSPFEKENENTQKTGTGSGAVETEGQDDVAIPPV